MPDKQSTRQAAIVLSKRPKPDLRQNIAAGLQSRIDYLEIADRLNAEIIDFHTLDKSRDPLVRAISRRFNDYWGLAVLVARRRHELSLIYVTAEDVGLLLAILAMMQRSLRFALVAHNVGTQKRSTLMRMLGKHMFRPIFCICSAQRDVLHSLGVPAEQVDRVNYFVDTQYFVPIACEPDDYVLSVGIEQRDYAVLLNALNGLPYPLRVIGSGWSPGSGFTEANVQSNQANVTIESNISSEMLKEQYARSRFVVVPLKATTYAAGVTTLLEAMAMGKAVIVSDSPGIRDYVKHGVSGIVVPVGDKDALRAAIETLWRQPDLAATMGNYNRIWVERVFSLEHYVDSVIASMQRQAAR